MSVAATLYFKSGTFHDGSAPSKVDPEGRFVFGRNLPKMLDHLDDSARDLGVAEVSQFVWQNPLYDEGGLDELSEEEFQQLQQKCDATAKWIPIERGLQTFNALASRHKLNRLRAEETEPTQPEYFVAFEIACFQAALEEAASRGERAFHIQCD
jgi:hypothetical protein